MGVAERFFALFGGLARAHGRYTVGAVSDARGKRKGTAETVREPPTVELWERHLAGTYGLGIIPIRDDARVVWAAIDVDVYDGLDHVRLNAQCRALDLPLVVARTKSGGAHLFLFLSEPTDAELVRGKLMEWAIALGHPGVEVFPKQTRLASANDVGNWLNMPYFGGARSLRYALGRDDQPLTLERFLDHAGRVAIAEVELRALELPPEETGELLEGAPPCLCHLGKVGVPEGSRNNALFNFGVYAKKRYGDDWQPKLDELNQRYLSPPLGAREVTGLAKSLARKNYGYKCKDAPIASCCNRQICLTREFGVGGTDDPGVVFGELIKLLTDPVTWIWDVDGARLELSTSDLMDQRSFNKKVVEYLNKWPDFVKPNTWRRIVSERLATVKVEEIPVDATPRGQLWEHLQHFCTSRARAREADEILLGKPWPDPATGYTWFRSRDFMNHLKQQRETISLKDVYRALRALGLKKDFRNLKGKGANLWGVPSFPEQTEPFDVPRTQEKFNA